MITDRATWLSHFALKRRQGKEVKDETIMVEKTDR